MSRPVELSEVLARLKPTGLLLQHAVANACVISVLDGDGVPFPDGRPIKGLRLETDNGKIRVEGSAFAAASPVSVFETLAGYVVVVPPGEDRELAERVASHGAWVLAELCAREYELNDLSREILSAYEELNLFYDLAGELAGAPDLDAICEVILDKACRVIRASRAWILERRDGRDHLRVVTSRNAPDAPEEITAGGSGIAGRVLASRTAEMVDDVSQLDPSELGELERVAKHSIITVPLCVPGNDEHEALGVLQLVDKLDLPTVMADATGTRQATPGTEPFTAGDLKLSQALASQGAILIENSRLIAYERELRIAHDIQAALMPPSAPQVEGLDVAGACEVASNVGGDYYDHLEIGNHLLGLLVADVSGHNLAAALMQTAARSTFRAAMLTDPSPVAVLQRTNRALFDDLSRAELFLTAWLGLINATTGELTFGDAGHNAALLCRKATGKVECLAVGGVPIGVLANELYREASVVLQPGDAVLAYTDGVTEAKRPGSMEEFGEVRLVQAFSEAAPRPAAEVVEHILAEVARFDGGGAPGDDRTLLVLKLREPGSR